MSETEWEVTADMARRILPPEAAAAMRMRGPDGAAATSIDRPIWAIEIVIQGKLHRLSETAPATGSSYRPACARRQLRRAHRDPDKARIIATALAALDQTQIETVVAKTSERGGARTVRLEPTGGDRADVCAR